ncbi:MAG: glutamate--cysteine ligase [Candidatus Melainabacteria bacterium]|nr:glutamate--cysteine ligase [Candidatus Melainabacteria bacterium]
MPYRLLKKGIEVELFAGTKDGNVLPLSSKLKDKFSYISQEPDERNFEYITKPCTDYNDLFKEIITPRIKVRNYLNKLDNLILIPGSAIPLHFDKCFYSSNLNEPYYKFIFNTYKHRIITTSLHINIGIENYDTLFKLLCALRLDTPLFLALSASSCFHDGKLTGFQSYRWHSFPKTPTFVPFFTNHKSYISWINKQLANKEMYNIRHLWTSIRPNGPNRPYKLNRIEIRICDLVSDTKKILAIVSFIESIIQRYLIKETWPKVLNKTKSELNKLVEILDKQEELVAKDGLKAKIWDWRNERSNEASKIIESLYKENKDIAKKIDVLKHYNLITNILEKGNESTEFLVTYKNKKSIDTTMQYFIQQFKNMDLRYYNKIK